MLTKCFFSLNCYDKVKHQFECSAASYCTAWLLPWYEIVSWYQLSHQYAINREMCTNISFNMYRQWVPTEVKLNIQMSSLIYINISSVKLLMSSFFYLDFHSSVMCYKRTEASYTEHRDPSLAETMANPTSTALKCMQIALSMAKLNQTKLTCICKPDCTLTCSALYCPCSNYEESMHHGEVTTSPLPWGGWKCRIMIYPTQDTKTCTNYPIKDSCICFCIRWIP